MFDKFRRLITGKGEADKPEPAPGPKLVPLKLTPRSAERPKEKVEPAKTKPRETLPAVDESPKVEPPPAPPTVEAPTPPSPVPIATTAQMAAAPAEAASPEILPEAHVPASEAATVISEYSLPTMAGAPAPPEAPTLVSASAETAISSPLPTPPAKSVSDARAATNRQAREYLDRVQDKINKLTDDFAEGAINRDQFRKLYEHYQRERKTIETLLASDVKTGELKAAISEGYSVVIRREHSAKAEGYAIYENESGMPLKTIGHFEVDPALVVPMLSSFRSAAKEIFGAALRSTEIEGGKWMCFVPGLYTTMLAIFSKEPAQRQQEFLEGLHRLFERANRHRLSQTPIDVEGLLFPHEFYSGQ
jgi:hypothetical protein